MRMQLVEMEMDGGVTIENHAHGTPTKSNRNANIREIFTSLLWNSYSYVSEKNKGINKYYPFIQRRSG